MPPESSSPLISIIMIFFNSEKYISEAVESVLNQTYKRWELLLVDDGSKDRSTAIVKEYCRKYPEKIFYLEHHKHTNLGKSSSRNLGIKHSKGTYIAFLDSDDVFLPDKLQEQLSLFGTYPEAGMVFGNTEYWYSWDKDSALKDYVPDAGIIPFYLYNPPALALFFLEYSRYTPCICSLLIRREIVLQLKCFEESIQDLFEDQVLIYKICLTTVVLGDKNHYERYRQHPESTSAIAIKENLYHPVKPNPSRLHFIKWLSDYVRDNNIHNTSLDRIIHNELRIFRYPQFFSLYLPAKNILRKIKKRIGVKE